MKHGHPGMLSTIAALYVGFVTAFTTFAGAAPARAVNPAARWASADSIFSVVRLPHDGFADRSAQSAPDFGFEVAAMSPGGTIRGVAVSGDTALITAGRHLEVLDVRDPSHVRSVGRVALPGYLQDVIVSGRYAYVAAGVAGVRVVDWSNPTAPVEVASIETGGYVCDVAVSGSVLCLVDRSVTFEVYDVGDPSHPMQQYRTTIPVKDTHWWGPRPLAEMWANVACVYAGDTLRVFDVSDPAAPVQAATLPSVSTDAMSISNGMLAIASGGFCKLIDVRSPHTPQVHAFGIDAGNGLRTLTLHGGQLWVEFVAPNDAFTRASLYDVSDPDAPVYLGSVGSLAMDRLDATYAQIGPPAAIAVAGRHAFVATNSKRLYIVDRAAVQMGSLERLGFISYPGRNTCCDHILVPTDIAVSGSYCYAFHELTGTLRIIDFSNPEAPESVGTYLPGASSGTSHGVQIASGRGVVYLGMGNVLRTVDVANPAAPQLADSLQLPVVSIFDMACNGNLLAVSGDLGFCLLDVTDPRKPELISTVTEGYRWAWRVAIDKSSAFLVIPRVGVQRVDLSDPANPVLDWVISPPWYHYEDGPTLNVACENGWLYMGNADEVWVVDIRDPHSPRLASTLPLGEGEEAEVAVSAGVLYVSNEIGARMQVFDVRNPEFPVLVAETSQFFLRTGFTASGCYLYTTTSYDGGLYVDAWRISHPAQPAIAGHYDVPRARWHHAGMDGDVLYASVAPGRVIALDATDPTLSDTLHVYDLGTKLLGAGNGTVVVERSGQLHVFDAGNPRSPMRVASVEAPYFLRRSRDPWKAAANAGLVVWYARWGQDMLVIDTRDPANVRTGARRALSDSSTGVIRDVSLVDGYAYVLDTDNYLTVIDVQDVDRLTMTASGRVSGRRLAGVRDGFVFTTGYDSIRVYVANTSGTVRQIGGTSVPGMIDDLIDPVLGRDVLYGFFVASGGLVIGAYSVRDPARPVLLGMKMALEAGGGVLEPGRVFGVGNDHIVFAYERQQDLIALRLNGAVPVALQHFDATPSEAGVNLSWRVVGQRDIERYRVLRAPAEGDARDQRVVAEVVAHTGDEYAVVDRSVAAGATYRYTLMATEAGGGDLLLGSRSVSVRAPGRVELGQNKPNPFNPTTRIPVQLPAAMDVELVVYDVAGRRVATLHRGRATAGRHEYVWDGRNDSGQRVASGVYLYRLRAGRQTLTRKMIVLK